MPHYLPPSQVAVTGLPLQGTALLMAHSSADGAQPSPGEGLRLDCSQPLAPETPAGHIL